MININDYRRNYEANDYELIKPTEDMVDYILDYADEKLGKVNCSYRWVSHDEVTIVLDYGCNGNYNNSYLRRLLSEAYDKFTENMQEEDEDNIDMDAVIEEILNR